MKTPSLRLALLFLLCASALVRSAQAAPVSASGTIPGDRSAAKADVQRMVDDFGSQRQDLLNAHKAAIQRLRAARTEEERQRILTEVRQRQRERVKEQREFFRRKRDQMQQDGRPPSRPSGG